MTKKAKAFDICEMTNTTWEQKGDEWVPTSVKCQNPAGATSLLSGTRLCLVCLGSLVNWPTIKLDSIN